MYKNICPVSFFVVTALVSDRVAGDILIFLFFSLTIWKRSAMLWIEKMLALERAEC